MRLTKKIVLASTNRDKFDEFQSLFKAYPEFELAQVEEFLRNPGNLKFAERYDTYLENATAKARLVNLGSHYPALADDSGLEVLALGGKPGVRSHRFATPRAGVTQDQANIELLLSEMKAKSDRTARFTCTTVLVIEGILLHASGILEGTIAEQPRGANGFGYDPIFIPKGSDKTFAEMSEIQKNEISHRAKALKILMEQAQAHSIAFAKP